MEVKDNSFTHSPTVQAGPYSRLHAARAGGRISHPIPVQGQFLIRMQETAESSLLKPIQLYFTSVQLLRAYPQSSLIHSDPSASSAPVRRGSPRDTASSRSHTLSRRHGRRSNCSQRRPGGRNQAVSSGQEELLWRGRWEFVPLSLEALMTASMKVMQGYCFMLAAGDQRCCCTAVKAGPILQPSPIVICAEAACVVQSSQRPPVQAYAA